MGGSGKNRKRGWGWGWGSSNFSRLIWPLGTNFREILFEIHISSFKNMHLKISSAKCWPFCLGLNVLKIKSACKRLINVPHSESSSPSVVLCQTTGAPGRPVLVITAALSASKKAAGKWNHTFTDSNNDPINLTIQKSYLSTTHMYGFSFTKIIWD